MARAPGVTHRSDDLGGTRADPRTVAVGASCKCDADRGANGADRGPGRALGAWRPFTCAKRQRQENRKCQMQKARNEQPISHATLQFLEQNGTGARHAYL